MATWIELELFPANLLLILHVLDRYYAKLTSTKREASDIPNGREHCRPDAVLVDQLLKLLPVELLLVPHVLDGGAFGRVAEDGHLPGVDAIRAQLPCVVHANYFI